MSTPVHTPAPVREPQVTRAEGKPRVLFIDHTGALGGGEISLLPIVQAYRACSRVMLFSDGPFRTALESAGVGVDVLPSGRALLSIRRESRVPSARALMGGVALARRVAGASRGYDVIYANSQKAFIIGALAAVWARRPVMWHLRDILDSEHFSSLNIRVAVALANHAADLVICNSQATADAFVQQGGDRTRVRVVYSGVVAQPFLAVSDDAARAARANCVPGSGHVVGLFGRLAPWKGQHVAIEAIGQIPGVHLLLVGGALFGEDAYEARLRQRADELGIADRVHFLGVRNDVPTLMRAVDVIVHTSVSAEPFGRVIVEAMLAARPVIATAAGGAIEIVVDGETGVLVPPGDSTALAMAVRKLLSDASLRNRMGSAGRDRALGHFESGAMVRDVECAVAEVVAR
jgi:glycosyltransferase involved in cell wall biosynthesis